MFCLQCEIDINEDLQTDQDENDEDETDQDEINTSEDLQTDQDVWAALWESSAKVARE
jgi:hypothetical protein